MLSEQLPGPVTVPPAAAHAAVVCRAASSPEELAEHLAIRHRIFVEEQRVFAGSDRDARDDGASVALLGFCDGRAAGTVRLFALDPARGVWQGDRLAVLPAYRTRGVGAPLVRCAVATAGAHGGRTMVAHIQTANVVFFERLGWSRSGPTEIYAGLPHQPMRIDLPAREDGAAIARSLAEGVSG